MSLMCLDVGFGNMGCAIIQNGMVLHAEVITTEKSRRKSTRVADDYAWRSAQLARRLKVLIGEYGCRGIVGELPSGGAQDASAMAMMNMATAIVSTVAEIMEIPTEWCTPTEVKKAACGYASASKREVMDAMVEKFGGRAESRLIEIRNGARAGKTTEQRTYWLSRMKFCSKTFEHIADSLGAYLALSPGNLVKMFG